MSRQINWEKDRRSRLPKEAAFQDSEARYMTAEDRGNLIKWCLAYAVEHGIRKPNRNARVLAEQISHMSMRTNEAWDFLYRLHKTERRRTLAATKPI